MSLKTAWLRATSLLYRLSLRCLPNPLRTEYREDFDDFYRELIRDAERAGAFQACLAPLGAIWNVFIVGIAERCRSMLGYSPVGPQCTPKARRALKLAAFEASAVNDACCGAGHVLVALLREGRGLAANVLRNAGMAVPSLRSMVTLVAEANAQRQVEGPPMGSRSQVLTSAAAVSSQLGHNFIGTEHLLLALLRDPDEIVSEVFLRLNVAPDSLRAAILSAVADPHRKASHIEVSRFGKNLRRLVKAACVTGLLLLGGISLKLYAQNRPEIKPETKPAAARAKSFNAQKVRIPLNDNRQFECTLILPESAAPAPAVLMIPGYVPGYHNQYEEAFRGAGQDSGSALSRYLASLGIAALQIPIGGGTSGKEPSISADDLADRARQCVSYLKNRPEIDPNKVGIIGQSIGGYIAIMTAAKSNDVAFVVTLATPVESIDTAFLEVLNRLLHDGGAPETERLELRKQMAEIFDDAKKGVTAAELRPKVEKFLRTEYKWLTNAQRKLVGKDEEEFVKRLLEDHVQDSTSPMFRSLIGRDITKILDQIHCPRLILFAEHDPKVEPTRSAAVAEAAIKNGNAADCVVEIISGADHFFETDSRGAANSNDGAEQRFAPQFLDTLRAWLLARTS